MNFAQLLQVIAATCLLTVAFMLVMRALQQRVQRWLQRYLPPRYLKARGIRRRAPASPTVSETHE